MSLPSLNCPDDVIITDELARRRSRPADHAAESRTLVALARMMAEDPESILQKLVDAALELCRAESAGVSILETVDGKAVFRWQATAGSFARLAGAPLPRHFSPCGEVIDRRATLLMADPARFYHYVAELGSPISEVLLIPFYHGEAAIGTIWIVAHTEGKTFEAEDARLMTSLSQFASAAVQARSTLKEARTANRELQDIRSRMESSLAAGAIGTWSWDIQADRFFADASLARLFSASPGDAAGGPLSSFSRAIHPEDQERVMAHIQRTIETGGPFEDDYRVMQPDGSVRWITARGQVERDAEGRPVRFPGVVVDITRRKVAEEALRQSEQRERRLAAEAAAATVKFRAFFDQLPYYAGFLSLDGTVIEVCRFAMEACGFRQEDVVGKPFWETGWWRGLTAVQERIRAKVAEVAAGQPYTEVLPYVLADGAERVTDFALYPIRDEAGQTIFMIATGIDITDRKRAEETLRERDERLRLLVNHATDYAVIISDPEGRITEWKGGAEQILGWREEEVLGKSTQLFFTPEDRAIERRAEEMAIAVREGRAEDKRWHLKKDGSRFFADGVMIPLRGLAGELRGFGKVLRDATNRKRAEEEAARLFEAEKRRATLLRQVAVASRSINASLSVESITRTIVEEARAIIGAHQAVIGLTNSEDWSQVINAVSLSDKYAEYRSYTEQPDGSGIYSAVCRSNEPMRLTQAELCAHPAWRAFGDHAKDHPPLRGWLAVPLTSQGGKNLGLLQLSDKYQGDFTEEDEAILTQLAAIAAVGIQNARLYEQLREQDVRKDEFLATLAHELRNPLAPIRTGLELLKNAPSEDADRRAREIMERQIRHMVHLIDDLLDISRVSRGKVELKREPVTVQGLVESAIETSRPLVEAAQHALSVRLPEEPLVLQADPIRLSQVLSNLINNSAKYTPNGGRIEVSAERHGPSVVIRVEDNGVGIPEDMLPKVFDIFTQVGQSLDRAQGGLGIGLSLVKRLVEMHGGTVEAGSKGMGRGSTFTVRLPLATEALKEVLPAAPVEAPETPRSRALHVLVVDDNVDGAESLAMLLELNGHDTRCAYTGPEALKAAREYPPDLMFLDIGLPGMNGYEVAQELRKDRAFRGSVLVALTGWGSAEDRKRSKDVGFDYHLTKPVDPAEVEALLSRVGG